MNQQNEPTKDQPTSFRLLLAPQSEIYQPINVLPMPKSLTALLPVFDSGVGKIGNICRPFRNNIKMYPHLTAMKISYPFSFATAPERTPSEQQLQRCEKKTISKKTTAFKLRFEDFQSSAKARCKLDTPHF